MAFRVPVADVSVVDLTVKLTKSTDCDTLCKTMKSEANSNLKVYWVILTKMLSPQTL